MTDEELTISVVIPAYNEAKNLARTLESITKQTVKPLEVIVVDNNSTDNTAHVARSQGARVLSETKKGIAAARQAGFMQARGEIIVTTDADTVVPKNWLERIQAAYKKDPNLVGYGGLYRITSGTMVAKLSVKYLMYPLYGFGRLFSDGWLLIGPNMSVHAKTFREVGGFDTKLIQGEDTDISQKLAKKGKVLLVRDSYVHSSGRRYEKGLFKALMSYGLNWPIKVFLKRDTFQRFEDFR